MSGPQSSRSPKVVDASVDKAHRWLEAAVRAIIDDRTGLRGKEKLLLLALARRDNDGSGICWPSLARLIDDTGTSYGSVRRAIESTRSKGWLEVENRPGRHGNDSNLFRVIVCADCKQGAGRHADGCAAGATVQGDLGDHPGRSKGSPRPIHVIGQGDRMDAPKDLSSSLKRLSLQEISSTPPPKEGGVGGGNNGASTEREDRPELAEAVHVLAACADEQRRVGAHLARNELHHLASALLAKGLEVGLLVVAAQQYRDRRGPWDSELGPRASRNLSHGIAAIADDVVGWSRQGERRAKRVDRPPPANAPDLVRAPSGRLVERKTVNVCMLSLEQLAKQQLALDALVPIDPTRGIADALTIDCGSTSREQRANLEGTLDVAEGGSR